MNAFFNELGKRLAERWLTLLVLPGLLFVATVYAASVLGQSHWYDLPLLRQRLTALAVAPAARTTGGVVLAAAVALLAASAAAFIAQSCAFVMTRAWLGDWPRVLGLLSQALTARRKRCWQLAAQRYEVALLAKARQIQGSDSGGELEDTTALNAARNRISLEPPQRPTWAGDRMASVAVRVDRAYDLDLVSAWPRLLLVLPDAAREELRAASERFDAASRLAGWSLLYLATAPWWWPGAVLGSTAALIAWVRSRSATDSYAELVEAAVDVHGGLLAQALGLGGEGPLTPERGLTVRRRIRKGR